MAHPRAGASAPGVRSDEESQSEFVLRDLELLGDFAENRRQLEADDEVINNEPPPSA